MMVKVKVQTCGSEEVSGTNVIRISTEVSGLKRGEEEMPRMQMGRVVPQGEGGTAAKSDTKDISKHSYIIL